MNMPKNPKAIVIEEDFTVDKSIIRHLIFSQAGSLYKAILELAMNSLDAKCTKISIDFSGDMKKVTVSDNGVGFNSVKEIKELFGKFGFDHQTEEELARGRSYGRFGLGRAQCLAFGSTVWKTNNFSMIVDLKGNSTSDLPYIITDHKTLQHKGCEIELSLYETMSIHDKRSLIGDLKRMAKYVSEEILVDGIHINEDINAKKWTAESDEFWFAKAQSERGLTIYNKGVYVTTYNHSKFGVSGDLISRNKNFDVNMARNDVLQSTCELWKLIPSFVKPFTVKKQQAKKLTDQDRIFLIAQMLKGEIRYDDVRSKRLFQNADGKYASLKQLVTHASGKITIAPSRWKQSAGTGLHSKKIAFCLSYDFLEQHNFETLNDFIMALKECGMFINDYTFKLDLLTVVPFESAASTVNENHDIIPEDKLTALDLARLNATRAMYKSLLEQYIYIERCSGRVDEPHTFAGQENFKRKSEREVNVGRSELAEAWTDGQSYIAIEVGVLRSSFENGLNGLLNLISIITHEMCHENPTYQSHDHDGNFYERFHDILCDNRIHLFAIAAKGLDTYLNENNKMKRQLSNQEIKNTFRTFERLFKKIT